MLFKKMAGSARNVALPRLRKTDSEMVSNDTDVLPANFNFNHYGLKGLKVVKGVSGLKVSGTFVHSLPASISYRYLQTKISNCPRCPCFISIRSTFLLSFLHSIFFYLQ